MGNIFNCDDIVFKQKRTGRKGKQINSHPKSVRKIKIQNMSTEGSNG